MSNNSVALSCADKQISTHTISALSPLIAMYRYCNVKPLVLVIGDSHVFWLKQFVVSSDVRFCPGTSGFEAWDCRVNFAGYRSGTTRLFVVNPQRNVADPA